jgi:ABC-2 type transport system permease protein
MQTIKIILHFWKLNLLSALEYKLSFFTQVFMMILNDFLFVFIWVLFFKIFWSIWWLDIWTFFILISIMVLVFWIMHTFFWWYSQIGYLIENWKIDSHLLLPKNILIRLIVSWLMISAIWDVFYSFIVMCFIPNLTFLMVIQIIFYSIIWSFTFLGFMIIFNSLSFYIWSSKNIVTWMFEWVLWPSHYPPWIYDGSFLKYVFLTILPVYFIIFWEFKLILNFDFLLLLKLLLASIFFLSFWFFVFYKWLKKYESWNMINTNI